MASNQSPQAEFSERKSEAQQHAEVIRQILLRKL
jgi:hypothetical protein